LMVVNTINHHSKAHSTIDKYFKGILQWRPSNPIRKMNYMDA